MKVRRMLAGSAVLAAVAMGVVGAAAPAFATDDEQSRTSGFVMYRDCNYNGPFFQFTTSAPNGYVDRFEFFYLDITPIAGNVSSVDNRMSTTMVTVFFNGSLSGPRLILLPHQRVDLCFGGFGNDAITSHIFDRAPFEGGGSI